MATSHEEADIGFQGYLRRGESIGAKSWHAVPIDTFHRWNGMRFRKFVSSVLSILFLSRKSEKNIDNLTFLFTLSYEDNNIYFTFFTTLRSNSYFSFSFSRYPFFPRAKHIPKQMRNFHTATPVNRPLGIVSESVKRRSSYQTTLPYERRVSALQLDAVKGPQHLIFSGCA